MDWSQPWTWFTLVAGLASIVSLGFTIPTFVAAQQTQKAIQKHDDTREFREEIEGYIKQLEGIHNSMKKDSLFNRAVVENIVEIIDTILIQYETVVNPFISSINELKQYLEESLERIESTPDYNQNNIKRALHVVIEQLKKARKRT